MTWEQEIQLAAEAAAEKATMEERNRNEKIIAEKDAKLAENAAEIAEQARKIAALEEKLAGKNSK